MRQWLIVTALIGLTLPLIGCGSGWADASLKPEVTGKGPSEPGGPAKFDKAPKDARE